METQTPIIDVIVGMLPLVGLISVIIFGIRASKFNGEFTNEVILKYSGIFAGSISGPILIGLLSSETADLRNNGFPFILIVVAATFLIYLHWKLYRYIAAKAEASGRSYGAFLILAILFPLITLLVVSIFKTGTGTAAQSQAHAIQSGKSLDEQLANLQNLRNQGVLSEEEFVNAKAKLLS